MSWLRLAIIALPVLLAAQDTAVQTDSGNPLAWAIVLFVAALALLALEFAIVSIGMLAIASALCGLGSIIMAFQHTAITGWTFLIAVPIVGTFAVLVGFRLLARSRAVVQTELTTNDGYAAVAAAHGARVGSVGTLLTDSRPAAKARFAGTGGVEHDIDVIVEGGALIAGDRVVIQRLNGPTITVIHLPPKDPPHAA